MNVHPNHHFIVLNRDRETFVRYSASFVPRVGDTIAIGRQFLKVVDVVIHSEQFDGAGSESHIQVHAKETTIYFDAGDCKELELNEFCEQMG